MSGQLDLTPGTLESLLSDLDREAFVSFVADIYDREGWTVSREGPVLGVTRPNGDRQRILVWTDERSLTGRLVGDPVEPPADRIDAVMSRGGDADSARAIASRVGADSIDTGDLHERLLYAVDREDCRRLCREHLNRSVEPTPPPTAASKADGVTLTDLARPGAFLVPVVAVTLLVIVVAGVPGSGPTVGPGADQVTPVGPGADQIMPVIGGEHTPSPVPSVAVGEIAPEKPSGTDDRIRLSIREGPTRTGPGSTITVTSSLQYDEEVSIASHRTTLVPPGSDWTVERRNETASPDGAKRSTWNVTVPDAAEGRYDLTVITHYIGGPAVGSIKRDFSVVVEPPESDGCPDGGRPERYTVGRNV